MKSFDLDDTADHVSQAGVDDGSRKAPANTIFIVVRGMILAHTFPVCVAARPMAFNQDVKGVVANPDVHPRFLAHWFVANANDLLSLATASTHGTKKIDLPDLLQFPVRLPPAGEQRRIAEIFDTANKAIRDTEAVTAKARLGRRGLLLALLERDGLQREPLSEAVTRIEAGKSPDLPDRPAAPGDWGVLKVSSIGDGEFYAEENKEVTRTSLRRPEYEVRVGDVLLSRANTSDLVGLVCHVEKTPPHIMLCDKTLRLVVNSERALAPYVALALSSPSARRQISVHATGTSGSMKNISQTALLAVRVPLPTRAEQRYIVTVLDAAAARIRAEEAHLTKLKLQKRGLMQDLLTGRVRVTM